MSGGRVEEVMEALADAARQISVAGGYRTDVVKVWRHTVAAASMTSLDTPAVFVLRAPDQENPIRDDDENLSSQELDVVFSGLVRPAAGQNAEDAQVAQTSEALLSDLKRLQMSDPRFGRKDLILNSRKVADSITAGWESPDGVVSLRVRVMVAYGLSEV